MNKKLNGAAAPKRYESPALAVLDVNLENGYASGNIGDNKYLASSCPVRCVKE